MARSLRYLEICRIAWARSRIRVLASARTAAHGRHSGSATLVTHYLSVGPPGAALEAIFGRENDLDWPTVAILLEMRVAEINSGGACGGMDSYHIERLFKKLRQRSDVPRKDLARWEYAFFPLIQYRDQDLVIYELMASDPEFFVSILSDVFVEARHQP